MKYKNKAKIVQVLGSLFAICFLSGQTYASETQNEAVDSFVVEDIEVSGLQRMELGEFFNLLPLQVGEKLEYSRVPTIIRTIHSAKSFEDIRLFREDNKLIIDLIELPTISDISIEGNSDIESEQIIEAMRKSGFAKGEVYDPSIIKNIKAGMEEQYFAHGKYSIKIDEKIIKQSRNRVYVKFIVNEGDPAKIQRISIIGNQLFDDEELLKQFELSVGDGIFGIFSDDQYSREKLSGDLETLRSFYLDRGYLKYNNTSTQVSISPDRKGIYLTINIDEGDKFTVDDIIYSGELILDKERLKAMMPLIKGDTYSAAAVSFAEEQIKTSLGYYGYAFAKVVTIPKLNAESKTVELTLFIDPGKKVYINRINFAGNESTNDEVLRREVRLMEGGALSTNAVERSKLRLQRLTYLEEVEVETPKSEEKEDRVDINYQVKERSAGTLSGGVNYGNLYGLGLNANVSHSNFLGSGKAIQFGINTNKFTESYNVNYSDPYFTLNGVSAGAGIHYNTSDYSEIGLSPTTRDQLGLDISFGYPIDEVTRLNFGVGYSANKLKAQNTSYQQIIDFFEENGQDVKLEPVFDYDLFKFNFAISRNTLNRGIFPTRGTSQSLGLSMTGLASDLEYFKIDYNLSHYIPIAPGWTFLSSFKAGFGDGYGDDENLPYFENFSAGGSGTMRGFESNIIGPHLIQRFTQKAAGPLDPETGASTEVALPPEFDLVSIDHRRAAGGNARVLATLELIFPIPFAEESNSVRTSLFVDAGNVWNTKFDREAEYGDLRDDQLALIPDYSDPGTYRLSTGISLQWLSPMGPLTLSFSKALKKEPNDETESFSFDVGRTF